MVDNATVTNQKTTFEADSNTDLAVRSTERSGQQVQHVLLDVGDGSESLVTSSNPLPVTGAVEVTDHGNAISTTSFNSRDAATLAAGAVFQGVGEDVSGYGRAGISITTSNATDGVLTIEVSRDGVTWGGPPRTWSDTRFAQPHMWNIVEKYFRIKYTNGTTEANDLAIQVQYSNNSSIFLGHQLNETLLDETEAIVVRSVAVGQNPTGSYVNEAIGDSAFMTTANLAGAATYTSDVLSMSGYSQIKTELLSDTDGDITVKSYSDSSATDLIRTLVVPYAAVTGFITVSSVAFGDYMTWSFTNGSGSSQTDFYFSTKFSTSALSGQIVNVNGSVVGAMLANLSRAVNVGVQPDGDFVNTPSDGEAFQTTATLAADGVYTSAWFDSDGYNSIDVFIASDVASAADGLMIEYTDDTSAVTPTVRGSRVFDYLSPDVAIGFLAVSPKTLLDGFRVKYTNGSTIQAEMYLSATLRTNAENSERTKGGALKTAPINTLINFAFDDVQKAATSTTVDEYTYSLNAVQVGQIEITYDDDSHTSITRMRQI